MASADPSLHVVKIGGSVLPDRAGFARAAALIARLATARPLAVVVSAQLGRTDTLEAELPVGAPPGVRAAHLASGEQDAGRLLVEALEAAGCPAELVLPDDVFRLAGDPRAASIAGVLPDDVLRLLTQGRTPVVPGFIGRHLQSGELATMSRGGGDLSAVALAHALGAARAVLVKHDDVFDDDGGVADAVQAEAIEYARVRGVTVQVRGIGAEGALIRSRAPRRRPPSP